MTKPRLFFLSLCLFLLSSCDKQLLNECIEGEFIIEGVKYKNYNLKLLLDLNKLTFYSNGKVKLPSVFKYDETLIGDNNTEGEWNIITEKRKVYLNIESNNRYFKGKYVVNFEKDEARKAFVMYLNSDSLTLKSVKSDFNYVGNKSKMDKAVKLSNR